MEKVGHLFIWKRNFTVKKRHIVRHKLHQLHKKDSSKLLLRKFNIFFKELGMWCDVIELICKFLLKTIMNNLTYKS